MKSESKDGREKFRDWWGRIELALIRSATRMVNDEGRDIVQNVGILALKNLDRFAHYDDFARWCHIRTRYLALDEISRVKKLVNIELVEFEMLEMKPINDLHLELKPLIDKLPKQQKLVVLHKLAGYRTDEIARRMKVSLSTVRSNWRHAQKSLAEEK